MENFTIPSRFTLINVDESVTNVIYLGYNKMGTDEDITSWSIKKIDETVTNYIKITYGQGAWSNRTNLTYK